ncbi:MAG: bifunctional allantoicase/(S)-ureidoglycine aminohydrolase [Paracoccaceae bacterium]|nr:bifunctional allantoicase/(S)-ureidoglycine aminohydrolase [Paracoccaceae bacterium]MDE2675078.1 bifunctional allantoicase/(S)-ureidoglycine aminohydrolase [Paracoccaceae bacterium]MYJ86532.1 (S)-ureidoglycine aminohydrolase [Paracoccaceae bacterium]
MKGDYFNPIGGLPPQMELTTDRALSTNAYLVIPARSLTDIVTSNLPYWEDTRLWILAQPQSGFIQTFTHYLMEVEPGGGSPNAEPDSECEAILFITEGEFALRLYGDELFNLESGNYVYLPPDEEWSLRNVGNEVGNFHWIRKRYEFIDGVSPPDFFISHDREIIPEPMAHSNGTWFTQRFVDPDDVSHDMHVNIVSFEPGGSIPFLETHPMEHGIYILQGKGVYNLNNDWVEVEAGDYLALRAFCPQACYAGGPNQFRYLLYKDVNRHPRF